VAAARLKSIRPVQFASVACQGTTIGPGGSMSPLLGPGGQFAKIKSRFGSRPIDALIISIGGDDIGFFRIMLACVTPHGNTCGLTDALQGVPAALAGLPARLDMVIKAINSDSAAGTIRNVLITEYPDPMTGAAAPAATFSIRPSGASSSLAKTTRRGHRGS